MRHDRELHSSLSRYHQLYSPRFRSFSENILQMQLDGAGIDVQIFVVFQDYKTLIEDSITKHLREMLVSFDSVVNAVRWHQEQSDIKRDPCDIAVVDSLLQFLSSYETLIDFGTMMERKYHELYPARSDIVATDTAAATVLVANTKDSADKVNPDSDVGTVTSTSSSNNISVSNSKFVRVLWVRLINYIIYVFLSFFYPHS